MKKFTILILLFLFIVSGGCKFNNKTLALYDGGVITSGDLKEWLETRTIPVDSAKNENKQKTYLRQIALERLQIQEAKKAGYDTKQEYKDILDVTEGSFIAAYYRKKLRNSSGFSEEAVKARIIRLKGESEKSLKEKTALARTIITEINGGASFEEAAEKYSDDYSKKDGGYIGYITAGMREPGFIDAAFRLKKGEITREPVVLSGSVYIIKADDRVLLTPDIVDKIAGDEASAGRLLRRLKMNSVRNIESRMMSQPDVINNIKDAPLDIKTSEIFRIGEISYTAADLDKTLAISEKNRRASGLADRVLDDKRKRFILDKIFRDKLLEREALSQKVDLGEEYIRQWKSIEETTLILLFKNDVILKHASVTDDMVRAEYNRIKEQASRQSKGSQVGSYDAMKKRLKDHIVKNKRAETVRNLEQTLLDDNNYRVI